MCCERTWPDPHSVLVLRFATGWCVLLYYPTFQPTDTQYTFILTGKADRQRGETERKIFRPMIHSQVRATADAMPIRSQSLFRVFHTGAGSQSLGPSSTVFPGHRQGAGWDAGPRDQNRHPDGIPGMQGEDPNHCHTTLGLLLFISEWNVLRNWPCLRHKTSLSKHK